MQSYLDALLEKATQAAHKKDSRVLRVLIKKILREDFYCLKAWQLYHSYSLRIALEKQGVFVSKKLNLWNDKLLYCFLKLSQSSQALRLNMLLYAMRAFPASSSVLCILGEWALEKEAYTLTVWAWEHLNLKISYKKALVKLYSKLKLHTKAHDLAAAVLKEEPYCTEMMDLLQASQFYQSMQK